MIERTQNAKSSQFKGSRSERTCVACARRATPDSFARIVGVPDGGLAVDWRRNLPGRGANVCIKSECIEKAVTKCLIGRVLKKQVTYPKSEDLLVSMRKSLYRQLETLITSAVGARFVDVGSDMAGHALRSGGANCLILAKDGARCEFFVKEAIANGVPVAMVENKVELGSILGRGAIGIIAIRNKGLARSLMMVTDRLKEINF
jgi:predicted RNA-binding protein YlxR (DUF448 family)